MTARHGYAAVVLVLLVVTGCTKIQAGHDDDCGSFALAAAARPHPRPAPARKARSLVKKRIVPARRAITTPHGPVLHAPAPSPTKAKKLHRHHGHQDFCDD